MKCVGVIGVGSSLGADNIAELVVERLKWHLRYYRLKNKIQVAYYDRPGVYLLELIKYFKVVHFIDAIVSGKPLGYIHSYDDIASFQKSNRLLSSHGFGLVEGLQLGEALGCLPDRIVIHGIEIDNENPFNPTAECLIRASDNLAVQMRKEIINYFC